MEIRLPTGLFGSQRQLLSLERAVVACFLLFFVLPLMAGLCLPHAFGLTETPSASLAVRLLVLTATGGASFLIAVLPALLCVRVSVLWRLYTFLLFPVAVISLMMQAIMYKEFGTGIDERLMGLFEGNITALWAFAREKYHIEWWIAAILAGAAALSWWICRDSRLRWMPSPRLSFGFVVLFLVSGSLAIGMKPDIQGEDHYHPAKLASAPLLQLLSFAGDQLMDNQGAGYVGILQSTGEVTATDLRKEIQQRLGEDIDSFCTQKVSKPGWLRQRPGHVFLFLLESMEYELLVNPNLDGLAPRLTQFGREGLLVREFHAPTGQTIDSVHAMVSGAASLNRHPVPRALARVDQIDTLPRVMKRAGYKPLFYAASRRHFCDKGDTCEAYGYDRFIGCPEAAPQIRSNEWGVSDGDFFQWAKEELADLSSPHFITFLNVSNHVPYDAPWQDKIQLPDEDRLAEYFVGRERKERLNYAGHVRYADEMAAEMAYWLRERYPDSLFIFVGDHCSNKLRRNNNARVPLILWNDRVIDSGADASAWFGSHMDMVATLGALVLPEGASLRTLGRPVWDLSPDRVSSAGPFVVSAKGRLDYKKSADFEATVDSAARARALRCSAIDALSWGFLNDRSIPAGDHDRD